MHSVKTNRLFSWKTLSARDGNVNLPWVDVSYVTVTGSGYNLTTGYTMTTRKHPPNMNNTLMFNGFNVWVTGMIVLLKIDVTKYFTQNR